MPDPRPFGKLGCLPGQIPVGLRDLTYYVAGSLPKPPPSVAVPAFPDWGMLGNDTYGDCGVAGLQHGLEADATITHENESWATADQAVSYYLQYTQGQDSGVVLSQYLAYVRAHGYFGKHVHAYAPVAVNDIPTLQLATFMYGFAYTGIQVTSAMQLAFQNHQPWDGVAVSGPVIGGHCVPVVGYDDQFVYIITWGGVQAITYSAWHAIATEAWAIISGEFVARNGDGRGISLAALTADLDRLAN